MFSGGGIKEALGALCYLSPSPAAGTLRYWYVRITWPFLTGSNIDFCFAHLFTSANLLGLELTLQAIVLKLRTGDLAQTFVKLKLTSNRQSGVGTATQKDIVTATKVLSQL